MIGFNRSVQVKENPDIWISRLNASLLAKGLVLILQSLFQLLPKFLQFIYCSFYDILKVVASVRYHKWIFERGTSKSKFTWVTTRVWFSRESGLVCCLKKSLDG